ncbi:MAG: aldo/keto reductase [Candidatus Hydrogenedentes bacterium]|nr:aldo/keto reductase [Candidatus Hydrogenedentota bacterium]
MKRRRLGSSDLEVSALSFGAWQLGDSGYWGQDPNIDEQAAVDAAIDAGITLFDTAEGYARGESERALGRLLGPKRKDVLIASKVSPNHCAPADLRAACEASLQRLGTDVIDLYQVHWPIRDVPAADAYGELERLQTEGKIRAIGVSNFGPEDLDDWFASGSCVSDQLGYNLLFRAIEYEIVPACRKYNLGILVYMPVLQGILAGRWKSVDEIPENRRRTRHFSGDREGVRHGEPGCEELTFKVLGDIAGIAEEVGQPMATVAMAWLLAKPGVTSVIIGGRNPRQVTRNVGAADLELSAEVVGRLDEATEPLRAYFGRNCDMWQPAGNSRIR